MQRFTRYTKLVDFVCASVGANVVLCTRGDTNIHTENYTL